MQSYTNHETTRHLNGLPLDNRIDNLLYDPTLPKPELKGNKWNGANQSMTDMWKSPDFRFAEFSFIEDICQS